jgi:ubiquinone/menaquinone biosynthesis C-methylase UbiE
MMSEMQEEAWYFQEDTVKNYECFYQTKYKRADWLEKKLLKEMLDTLGHSEKLLEIGCGTGHFTRWLNSMGLECYGLDLSHLMLKEAKKLWPNGSLLQGESSCLPFKDKSFDVVAFIACLEYMPDITQVIEEAARVSRKGIIIGLMNKWSVPTMRRIIQIKRGKNPYYSNVRFYSIFDMKHVLKEALHDNYAICFWSTTAFPKIFGDTESALLPFGAFLGISIKLGENID